MNNLYEYIDPITSPYEAFCFDSNLDSLPIPAHWHYYVELLFILEGTIDFSINNMAKHAQVGSAILFPPKCVHTINMNNKSEHTRYYVIKFDPDIRPTCKTEQLDLRSALHGIDPLVHQCYFTPQETQNLNLFPQFQDIVAEYQNRDFAYSMILTADLLKIIGKFARIWQKDGHSLSSPGIHPSYEISFDLISEYIDTHYFEDLSVEKLAKMCNMSHSTFSLNFYRRYGMTCKEYITATRINVAENMLLFSNYDVAFIAQEVGYTDCSYFIRCYKKLKGITPKQARKAKH